ncbi:MAG: hypothetical protein ABDH91_05010 [Bacteroidia bacterium]
MNPLISQIKKTIPSLAEMHRELQKRLRAQEALTNFEEKLDFLDKEGEALFQNYQRQALYKLAEAWLEANQSLRQKEYVALLRQKGWNHFKEKVLPRLVELSQLVQRLEKDLGNMRKARAGALFQANIQHILVSEGISCEIPTGSKALALGRIDLVVPNKDEFDCLCSLFGQSKA